MLSVYSVSKMSVGNVEYIVDHITGGSHH